MIFGVLGIILFEFKSHLLLIHHFTLQLLTHLLLSVQILFQNLLVVGLLLRFFLVLCIQLLKISLVLLGNLRDEHSVVSTATVLQQDGKYFPNVRDHRVLLLSVLQACLD